MRFRSKLQRWLTVMLSCLPTAGLCQELSSLETISVEEGSKFHFERATARVINRIIENPAMLVVELAEVRMDRIKTQSYLIEYNSGASDDPVFNIYSRDKKKKLAEIPGRELFIPGDGSIYASGHTNSMFNFRRKFSFKDGKLTEMKQPYLFVGLETVALTDITLHSDRKLRSPLETVRKGSKISVLVADGEYFLVKTQFGLTGWTLPAQSQFDEPRPGHRATGIKGLFFKGD